MINQENIPPQFRERAQEEQKFSLGSFVKNAAIGMVVFTAAETLTNIGSRGLVKAFAPELKKIGLNFANVNKFSKPVGFGASISKMLKLNIGGELAPSIGELFEHGLYKSLGNGVAGTALREFMETESRYKGRQQSQSKPNIHKWFNKFKNDYISPVGAKSSGIQRFIAGTALRTVRTAAEMPFMYAIDRSFGNLYGYDRETPPASDLGGTVNDFFKYTKEALPGFIGFKSMAAGGAWMKYGAVNQLKKHGRFVEEVLKGIKPIRNTLKAAGQVYTEAISHAFAGNTDSILSKRMNTSIAMAVKHGIGIGFKSAKQAYTNINNISKQNIYDRVSENIRRNNSQYTDDVLDSIWNMRNLVDAADATRAFVKGFNKENNLNRNMQKSVIAEALDNTRGFSGRRNRINLYQSANVKLHEISEEIHRIEQRTVDGKFGAKYYALKESHQKYSGIIEHMESRGLTDLHLSFNNTMNIGNELIDLNKISRRGIGKKLMDKAAEASIKIPLSALSVIAGKPISDVPLQPFKMFGLNSIFDGTPMLQGIDKNSSKPFVIIDPKHGLMKKEVATFAGYISGRPFEMVNTGSGYQMQFAPNKQRFRSVSNQIFERTIAKMAQSDQFKQTKELRYNQRMNDITVEALAGMSGSFNIADVPKDPGAARDFFKKVIHNKKNVVDRAIWHTRIAAENVAYKLDLGKYGSGDESAIGNVVGRVSKFFDQYSNRRYMSQTGGSSHAMELLNTLKSTPIDDITSDYMSMYKGADILTTFHRRAKNINMTAMRNLTMKTNINQIQDTLKNVDEKTSELIMSPGKAFTFLDELIYSYEQKDKLTNSTLLRMSEQDIKNIYTARDIARQSISDSSILDGLTNNTYYGHRMNNLEFIQRTTLLAKGADEIIGKRDNAKLIDVFDTMISLKSDQHNSAKNISRMHGGYNPFRAQKELFDLEENNTLLRKSKLMFDFGFGEEDGNVNEFSMSSEFIKLKNNAENIEKVYSKYRGNWNRASEASHDLFSGRTGERDRIGFSFAHGDLLKPGGQPMVISHISNEGLSKEALKQIQTFSTSNTLSYFLTDRLNRVASFSNLAVDTRGYSSSGEIMKSWALKRMLPIIGAAALWETADAVTDILDIGPFDEGLNVAAAEQVIKLQDTSSFIRDKIGITSMSKYLEGLMPGVVNSPLAKLTRTVGSVFAGAAVGGLFGNPAAGAVAGLTASALQDFGLTDITATQEENRDIWSGRKKVPIKNGARWLLSKGFYGGDRISGFAPHWFARIKSQAQYTDVLYGSKAEALIHKPWPFIGVNPLGLVVDPYYYEKKNSKDRPYLYSSTAFEDVPFLGPVLAATVGQVVKPTRVMVGMQEGTSQLQNDALRIQQFAESNMLADSLGPDISYASNVPSSNVVAPNSLQATAHKSINSMLYQPLGIFGWAGKSASTALFGRDTPFEPDAMAESANQMFSLSRTYWDENMGDMLGLNEFWRRMLPNQDKGKGILPNTMPSWMPGSYDFVDFKHGDPFLKTQFGEYRLPGKGYELLNQVERTFPVGASSAGYDPISMAMTMAGLQLEDNDELAEMAAEGTNIHRKLQDAWMAAGTASRTEVAVYDPLTDMKGFVDAMDKNGNVVEIKTVQSVSDLEELTSIKSKHRAQVNVYLNALDKNLAKVVYVAREDPTQSKEFFMGKDAKSYMQTVRNVAIAKRIASSLPEEVLAPGAGYSHVDQLKILADVAPFSKSFQQEKKIVTQLADNGQLTGDQYYKYYEAIKMAEAQGRPTDMYPDRFLGNITEAESVYNVTQENFNVKAISDKVRRGETTNVDYDIIKKGLDAEYNMYNLNANIKDAADYNVLERAVGAAYELALKPQVPYVSRKLMQYWTPKEAYQRNIIQGTKDSYWNSPMNSFVSPVFDQTLASTNPIQGAIQGAFLGAFLGPQGAVMGAAIGGTYGATRGVAEQMNLVGPYIRKDIQEARKTEQFFDDMTAASAQIEMANGNFEARQMYGRTLVGSVDNPSFGATAGLPSTERSYISLIAATGNMKMAKEMMRYIPRGNAIRLEEAISGEVNAVNQIKNTYNGPTMDWNIINDDRLMDESKYEMLKESGVNTYVSGLGWKNQLIEFNNRAPITDLRNPGVMQSSTVFDEIEIKNAIYSAIRECGATGMVNTSPGANDDYLEVEVS